MKTKFGPNAAQMVFPIAAAFLTIKEQTLSVQLKTKSARACDYLDKIPMDQYTMDYNTKVTTTTLITTQVQHGDIQYK